MTHKMKSTYSQISHKTFSRSKHEGQLISIATDRVLAWCRWHLHAPHVEGMPREFADQTEMHGFERTLRDRYVAFRSNNTGGASIRPTDYSLKLFARRHVPKISIIEHRWVLLQIDIHKQSTRHLTSNYDLFNA